MVLSTNRKAWKYPEDNYAVSYVDNVGITWYRLECRYQFGDWIETHDNKLWKIHGEYHRAQYWVHEKLFGLILLKGV